MFHADHALARRLEGLIRTEYRRLAEVARSVFPDRGADILEVAGGVALWLGEGSPVNQAAGLGMAGGVREDDVERLEAFYHERHAAASAGVCQLADPSLFEVLGRRGWRVSQFEHVLALELETWQRAAGQEDLEVHACTASEREIWGRVAAQGFADVMRPGAGEEEFGRIMAARDEAVLVLAWAEGEPAGTGSLVIDGGVGWLSGDSTLPRYRRRGLQQAIQRSRLSLARDAGCDLAVTEAAPGSPSQRNMERLGFRIVYTHVEFSKEP